MREWQARVEQRFGAEAVDGLARYQALLVEWNERLNLTAIVDEAGIWTKHFWDSLLITAAPEWSVISGGCVADVGTGAGFPGLVLAICCRDRSYLLCDSLQKRLDFLQHVVDELGLNHVTLLHARAEDAGRNPAYRGQYDLVVSRAVARMNVLLELTAPLARVGGYVCAYKGPGVHGEMADGLRAAKALGLTLSRVDEVDLPGDAGHRALAWWRVEHAVPQRYPRRAGTPQRQPL
ncbi:MAG: 16S rRNA (guanine(527)-N(7))-methyltransferase RsmG [Thermoflavifilum sp.]|nr:16S rRNA (guanine(527)-N(7))-methyltransferase RsmG [Thermoflavifilum sp.]MCL6513094.1 16S rRNA (guanine(527)-N(7))-methyltransferase RsmG [Alicyclobacillus sp.]